MQAFFDKKINEKSSELLATHKSIKKCPKALLIIFKV
jgi:hypothetical protein